MKKIIYIALLLINLKFVSTEIFSQPVTQQWASRYQRTANSPALKNYLALDKLGNSYVCGTVFNTVTRNDIVVIKYNSNGDTVWTRRYNNNNNEDFPAGLAVDSAGNSYISSTSGPGGNLNVMLTIKYSPDGVLLWTRSYGFTGQDVGINDMKMNKAGNNIYLTGTNSSTASAVTICYNSNGDSLWVKTKGLAGYHYYGQNIAVDNNNNAYAALIRENNSTNLDDFLVVRYDTNGNEIWTTIHVNNTSFDAISGIAVDNFGNSFFTGTTFNNSFITIKLNGFGIEQWNRIFTRGGGGFANAIAVDTGGNCYVTGAITFGGSNFDFSTIKYNFHGDSIWVRTYDGPGNANDEAYAITLDDSNNVYITGRSVGNSGGWDYATIKYSSNGIQQVVMRYLHGIAYSVIVDKSYNIYVTGRSDTLSLPGYTTIKYSQPPDNVQPISSETPIQYALYQNYPNPFNPSTNIKFTNNKNQNVKLRIFDAMGKERAILVNQKLIPGSYEFNWNANDYPSGIYFYVLNTDTFTETKKAVLLK